MIKFDWSLNIGTIVTIVSIVVVFAGAHATNVRRLQGMETKIEIMFKWFENHVLGKR